MDYHIYYNYGGINMQNLTNSRINFNDSDGMISSSQNFSRFNNAVMTPV